MNTGPRPTACSINMTALSGDVGGIMLSGASHLTLAAQTRLLQPRPDALDAPGVFGMRVGVSTHALVLLHERVVHQT